MIPVLRRIRTKRNRRYEYTEKPIIVVMFDDFFSTDYTHAYPYMRSKGIKGTSYINTTRMGSGDKGNWTSALEMHSNGWDLQCHTDDHQDVATLTDQEIRDSMTKVNNDFIANGLESPKHHAYPFGSFNELAQTTIADYRETQRRTNYYVGDTNYYGSFQFNLIKSINADAQNADKVQHVKECIDFGVNNNTIFTMFMHRITDTIEPDTSVSIANEYFQEIIDYVANSGAESMTITEAVDYVKAYQEERGILN